jgi:hypothetical protein
VNGLMFKQLETRTKIAGKSGLKFEQKVEKRIIWSPSLSAWWHMQLLSQFSCDWFSEHLANSVCFLSFIYFFGLFLYYL